MGPERGRVGAEAASSGSFRIRVGEDRSVAARVDTPEGPGPRTVLVLAHGAGAGMDHDFMSGLTARLVEGGVAVVRYNFPYMEERGGWPPDRPPVLEATVRAAVEAAARRFPGAFLFAGGKSLGGRMTSRVAAADGWTRGGPVDGLIFFGFPLHGRGKPGTSRADHLAGVSLPLLFLQGTRDPLARLDLLEPVVEELGGSATLHQVVGADHGFQVLKRSGRSDAEVLDEVAGEAVRWMARTGGAGTPGAGRRP